MAKAKAPSWLTAAFAEGVVELAPPRPAPAYKGALGRCWLAQFDERRRPCELPLERAHLISRQRVENAFAALLPSPIIDIGGQEKVAREQLILLAAWDPSNGVIACEAHHRRLDGHMMPALNIPFEKLPGHVIEFAERWGLESELERRFPT